MPSLLRSASSKSFAAFSCGVWKRGEVGDIIKWEQMAETPGILLINCLLRKIMIYLKEMIWSSLDVDLAFNICRFSDLISCGHRWCWTRDPPCLRDTDLCQYTCHLGDTEATITVGIPLAEDGLDLFLVSKFPRNPGCYKNTVQALASQKAST